MQTFDLHTVSEIVLIALAGGVIGLDRTAFGQFMVSQPIVAAPMTGWLLGDIEAGMMIGAVLELIWVLDIPVGTFVPADATVGAVSATAVAAIGSPGKAPLDLVGFGILLTTAVVPITMIVDGFIRKRNSKLADAALAGPGEDADCKLAQAHFSGLGVFFLKSFALYLLLIPAGLTAVVLFGHLPDQVHTAMGLFVKSLPLLGAALVLRKLSIAAVDPSFVLGFAASAILTMVLQERPPVIVLLVTGIGFISALSLYRGQKAS